MPPYACWHNFISPAHFKLVDWLFLDPGRLWATTTPRRRKRYLAGRRTGGRASTAIITQSSVADWNLLSRCNSLGHTRNIRCCPNHTAHSITDYNLTSSFYKAISETTVWVCHDSISMSGSKTASDIYLCTASHRVTLHHPKIDSREYSSAEWTNLQFV